MEITGKVIAILPLQSGVSQRTGNPWAKQDYVVEMPGQYPRRVCFEVFGEDRINQFGIQMGEEITVSFDINAQEYQGKWYNKLSAWQVTRGGASSPAGNAAGATAQPAGNAAGTTATTAQQPSLFNQPAAQPVVAPAPASAGNTAGTTAAPEPQGGKADELPF